MERRGEEKRDNLGDLKVEKRNKRWQLGLCQSLNQVLTQSFSKWGNVRSNNTHNNSIITVIAI